MPSSFSAVSDAQIIEAIERQNDALAAENKRLIESGAAALPEILTELRAIRKTLDALAVPTVVFNSTDPTTQRAIAESLQKHEARR